MATSFVEALTTTSPLQCSTVATVSLGVTLSEILQNVKKDTEQTNYGTCIVRKILVLKGLLITRSSGDWA